MPTMLSDGNNAYLALAKWNIDSRAFVWCALPPMPLSSISGVLKEQRIGVSRNTIVWPKTVGPDGVISGIYLYDTINDTWQVDAQVPGYGNMLCNAITSLPDARQQIEQQQPAQPAGPIAQPPANPFSPPKRRTKKGPGEGQFKLFDITAPPGGQPIPPSNPTSIPGANPPGWENPGNPTQFPGTYSSLEGWTDALEGWTESEEDDTND
jgi:hypothetical protein